MNFNKKTLKRFIPMSINNELANSTRINIVPLDAFRHIFFVHVLQEDLFFKFTGWMQKIIRETHACSYSTRCYIYWSNWISGDQIFFDVNKTISKNGNSISKKVGIYIKLRKTLDEFLVNSFLKNIELSRMRAQDCSSKA